MAEQTVSQDVLAERLAKIPPIVDMDSHVVEPAHLWSDRLPERLRYFPIAYEARRVDAAQQRLRKVIDLRPL